MTQERHTARVMNKGPVHVELNLVLISVARQLFPMTTSGIGIYICCARAIALVFLLVRRGCQAE